MGMGMGLVYNAEYMWFFLFLYTATYDYGDAAKSLWSKTSIVDLK